MVELLKLLDIVMVIGQVIELIEYQQLGTAPSSEETLLIRRVRSRR